MLPSFLITFREVIEASFIVATILSILVKLKHARGIRTVWIATGSAAAVSVLLLGAASLMGVRIQTVYTGKTEELIEGILMVISALFITWAVFFLHAYFSQHKKHLLQKVRKSIEEQEQRGLFVLVFTAVFREGFEIVLFLFTIYLSSNPQRIFIGFSAGLIGGLIISLLLFKSAVRMSAHKAIRVTSALLILFAAGLLARGVHEFAEAGVIPEVVKMILPFIPQKGTFIADIIKSVFGITQSMDIIQLLFYTVYIIIMSWYVFFRRSSSDFDKVR